MNCGPSLGVQANRAKLKRAKAKASGNKPGRGRSRSRPAASRGVRVRAKKPTLGRVDSGKPALAAADRHDSAGIPGGKPGLLRAGAAKPGLAAQLNIKGLCEKLSIKHAHLAALLNTHPNTITKWNRGALEPDAWRKTMLFEFGCAAVVGFTWRTCPSKANNWTHFAADADFELPNVPGRLLEILTRTRPEEVDE